MSAREPLKESEAKGFIRKEVYKTLISVAAIFGIVNLGAVLFIWNKVNSLSEESVRTSIKSKVEDYFAEDSLVSDIESRISDASSETQALTSQLAVLNSKKQDLDMQISGITDVTEKIENSQKEKLIEIIESLAKHENAGKMISKMDALLDCPSEGAIDKYGYCIWHIEGYDKNFRQAAEACGAYGARLCSRAEVSNAQALGAEWCSNGWTADRSGPLKAWLSYPMQVDNRPPCGNSFLSQSEATIDSKWGANCCK